MIHLLSSINWLSVLAAFGCYIFLGPLWYLLLFKKQYAVSLGKENDSPQNPGPLYLVGPAVCSLIITITSALLMVALRINSYASAFEFAMVIGLGYLVSNTVNIAINPNIPKPILYSAISGAFHLMGIFIVSTVLYALN